MDSQESLIKIGDSLEKLREKELVNLHEELILSGQRSMKRHRSPRPSKKLVKQKVFDF